MYEEHEHKYNMTFHGLNHWMVSMFEKLGWMVLAERDGHHHKIVSYKKSLSELVEAIEEKIKCTHDEDRMEDLHIMHKNVLSLVKHVNNDFKLTSKTPKLKSKTPTPKSTTPSPTVKSVTPSPKKSIRKTKKSPKSANSSNSSNSPKSSKSAKSVKSVN
jgi:hypothetical protein